MKSIYLLLLASAAFATNYYVDSSNGDDNNSGLSEALPLKSLSKVNSLSLSPGDSVLFKRSETFRGQIKAKSGSESGDIVYAAYGNGEKPRIISSETRMQATDWTNEGENIWKTAVSLDAGNIIFNNESSNGIKKLTLAEITKQGDFYSDGSSLYLYSSSNPAEFYSSMEIAVRRFIIEEYAVNYITYENLDLRYGGSHGIGGDKTHHITVRNVDFSWIGGAIQYASVRYGNGVEFWNGAHDNIVERCTFNQIYDAAITAQGDASEIYGVYNLIFRNNIVQNSEYSFEFWEGNTDTIQNSMHDIYFVNNTCLNAGSGWGHTQRPDPRGSHLMLWGYSRNLVVKNNIFYESTEFGLLFEQQYTRQNVKLDNNLWYESAGPFARIYDNDGNFHDASDSASYIALSEQDSNSIFADPLLDSKFTPTESSPAIGNGILLSQITDDFYGTLRDDGNLDIGAVELKKTTSFPSVKAQDFATLQMDGLTLNIHANAFTEYSIWSLSGIKLTQGKASKGLASFTFNNSGIYIVKLNSRMFKLAVK